MTNETEYQRGYREGAEKMRGVLKGCLPALYAMQGDTEDLQLRDAAIHAAEEALSETTPQKEDDEREMREAFERDINNDDGNKPPLCEYSYKAGWQAAWKEKSK